MRVDRGYDSESDGGPRETNLLSLLTCSQAFSFGRQSMMLHPEPVLTLACDVGRIPRLAQAISTGCVRHLPLNVFEDFSLLCLGHLLVDLIVWPANLGLDFRDVRRGCRAVSWPLERVRRRDAVYDRCFIVPR